MRKINLKALKKVKKKKKKKYQDFHSDPTGGYLQGSRVEMDIPSLARAQSRLKKFMKG